MQAVSVLAEQFVIRDLLPRCRQLLADDDPAYYSDSHSNTARKCTIGLFTNTI